MSASLSDIPLKSIGQNGQNWVARLRPGDPLTVKLLPNAEDAMTAWKTIHVLSLVGVDLRNRAGKVCLLCKSWRARIPLLLELFHGYSRIVLSAPRGRYPATMLRASAN